MTDFALRNLHLVECPLVRALGKEVGVQCMAGTAHGGNGLDTWRGGAMVSVTAVTCGGRDIVLLQQGNTMDTRCIVIILIRGDPVFLHVGGI